MGRSRRMVAVMTMAAGALSLVAFAAAPLDAARGPLAGIDDDVPGRQPSLVWESSVDCDADAEIAEAGGAPARHCAIEFDHDAIYLHEHPGVVGTDGPFRLSAYDLSSGERRWSTEAGSTFEITLADGAIVLSDKSHIEVYDPETGALRFSRAGGIVRQNNYGVLLVEAGADDVVAIDASDGDQLWTDTGQVGAMCRDFVVMVSGLDVAPAPFRLLDNRTGVERWASEDPFDPISDRMTCSAAPWIYVTDGMSVREIEVYGGFVTWRTMVADNDAIDLYREVALVGSGSDVVALSRENGDRLWDAPADSIGLSVSWPGRLREDAEGLFTLDPLTGVTVRRVRPGDAATDGGEFRVFGVSDTRVVVAAGTILTTYGLNDLGVAWELDVGDRPDDAGVLAGHLVVRTGDSLRGYAVTG